MDFEKLKNICNEKGIDLREVLHESINNAVNKKDQWEGVEFAECIDGQSSGYTKGKIYQIHKIGRDSIQTKLDDLQNPYNGFGKDRFKPSTESAYVEQLKAEAFKRFGEIKQGDRFDLCFREGNIKTTYKISMNTVFNYEKPNDALRVGGLKIYESGKWATKLTERKKVKLSGFDYEGETGPNPTISFEFYAVPIGDLEKAGEFLAKKLEEYLNNQS